MNLSGRRLLALLADDVSGALIRDALPATAPVRVAELRDAVDRVRELLEETHPDLVVVGCGSYGDSALGVIREVADRAPSCPIVVLYQGSPNGFMESAFEAGAEDLIALPQTSEQLAFAFEKVLARRRGSHDGEVAGPMITVLGPKGGTGKTLTACNLAVALARKGARPIVLDIDLQFGDVGLALGLRPDRTIYDLATAGGSIDGDKIDTFTVEHDSGARVLLAPSRPDQAAAVDTTFLRKLFSILRTRYEFVIVDTPPAFSPEVIAAIDSSTHLCVVGMLDALSLKDTKIGFQTLQQMGYDPEDATLVLNRADTHVGISQADVRRLLERDPDVLVPSDRAIPRAITSGKVIVEAEPKSGAARAFGALADHFLSARHELLGDVVTTDEPSRRRTLLKRGR
ncbi:MAG TPA: AAA family ATPase [Gaiellaceae bacterium]|nr:AAA family ATPase [Gaiellaceae bacterium]